MHARVPGLLISFRFHSLRFPSVANTARPFDLKHALPRSYTGWSHCLTGFCLNVTFFRLLQIGFTQTAYSMICNNEVSLCLLFRFDILALIITSDVHDSCECKRNRDASESFTFSMD